MAILAFSPNGTYTTKTTLEAARTAADCANKTIVVTSALTQAQSNISGPWPTDRGLEIRFGGSLLNSTAFTFTDGRVFNGWQGYIFKGAGAVTGLKDVKPQYWGATGKSETDSTDATAAMQAALNSLTSGGVMRVPTGSYKITTALDVTYDNTTIIGDYNQNSKLYVTAPSAAVPQMIRTVSSVVGAPRKNVHIRGLYFYGNATVRIWSYTGGVTFANAEDSSVTDCQFKKLSAVAVSFTRYGGDNSTLCLQISVKNNLIKDCYSDGIYALVAANSSISNNKIFNIGTDGENMGILFEGMRSSSITGNVVYNSLGSGIYANNGSGPDPIVDSVISGNTVRTAAVYGIFSVGTHGLTISGNSISDIGTSSAHVGIMVHNPAESAFAVPIAATSRTSVTGNTIARAAGPGVACSTSGNLIANNYLEDNNASNTSPDGAITLFNNAGGTTYPCFNKISDNYAFNTILNENGLANGNQNYVVSIPANAKGNEITNNSGLWMVTGLILNAGTDTIRYGNKLLDIVSNAHSKALNGRAVLVGGTVTVDTLQVEAGDNIVLTRVLTGGAVGHLSVGTITVATNFVINSSSGTDTSTVYWEIRH